MRCALIALVATCGATPVAGCAQFRPPADGAPPSTTGTTAATIEDGEDGDNRTLVQGGRGGYLYTYQDSRGTTIEPSGEFAMSAGGANGSRHAMRIWGTLADASDVYAGVGLSLTEPKAPYDASQCQGIAFHARRGPGSVAYVRLKVPDINTDPDGGMCSECHNDFGIDFQVTEEWTRYVVSFADLLQQAGWGAPRPAAIDPAKLFSLQWQVAARGASFDLWIDDVSFVGCP